MKFLKTSKTFPSWLIRVASIGLGFFAFVIVGGALLNVASGISEGLSIFFVVILLGLAAGYFSAVYSRRFMMRHVSRNAAPGDPHFAEGPTARNKRVALAMFLSGLMLFPIFVLAVLSSIINVYA